MIVKVLVAHILEKYFLMSNCILQVFSDYNTFIEIDNFPNYVFYQQDMATNFSVLMNKERCEGFLVNTNNPMETLTNLEQFIKLDSFNGYYNRKYIILMVVDKQEMKEFKFLSNRMVFINPNNYQISRLNFKKNLQVIDYWFESNLTFKYNRNLFPNVRNFDGITLKVMTSDYLPYSDFETHQGFEFYMFEEFATKFNFSAEFAADNEIGEVEPDNFNGTGVLGAISSDEYDIAFGQLFSHIDRVRFSSFAGPTTLCEVTCLVPKASEIAPMFKIVFVANLFGWIIIFIGYFFIIFFKVLLQRHFKENTNASQFVHIARLFLLQSSPSWEVPKRIQGRLMFISITLGVFLITSMFSTEYTSTLVVPQYEKNINNMDDLAKSGILWGNEYRDQAYPLRKASEFNIKVVVSNFRLKSRKELRELSKTGKFAFTTKRFKGFAAVEAAIRKDIISMYRIMDSNIYIEFCYFILGKNSPIFDVVSEYLQVISESGLRDHWELKATLLMADRAIQNYFRYGLSGTNYNKLGNYQLFGAYIVLFVGLTISLITFIIELRVVI